MPRFIYEMTYPKNEDNLTITAYNLKELSRISGYTLDVLYNKLKNNCKRTNIIEIKRTLTSEGAKMAEKRKTNNKIIKKDNVKTRNNEKYIYDIQKNDEIHHCTKIREGCIILNKKTTAMHRILQHDRLMKKYNITLIKKYKPKSLIKAEVIELIE